MQLEKAFSDEKKRFRTSILLQNIFDIHLPIDQSPDANGLQCQHHLFCELIRLRLLCQKNELLK